ncbi:MAG: SbmA/BacA-like family transporter [bacterium]|nr:SbmA/BacA-like family transporter [bacterium]
MIKAFFASKKWFRWAYGGISFILISLFFQVQMSVRLNTWYGDFYDLLQASGKYGLTGIPQFYDGLIRFLWIAIPYVLLATITGYFTRLYSLRWRQAITFDYIPRWRNVKEEIEGASQRIQEDAFRFARIIESLGIQVAEAAMTLVAFIPILWKLSKLVDVSAIPVIGKNPIILVQIVLMIMFIPLVANIHLVYLRLMAEIPLIGKLFLPLKKSIKPITAIIPFILIIPIAWVLSKIIFAIPVVHIILTAKYIPGFLVWIALIVSVGGMVISWYVGSKLPGLEYNNQKVEAAFRKELVLGEDDKINHASAKTLTELFTGIRFNYHRLFLHYGYFDVWRGLFNQCMVLTPYVIMGHGLFTGFITLGVLQKVANSFDQVRACFSLFINNWTTITELRSIHMRLKEFEGNLDKFKIAETEEKEE